MKKQLLAILIILTLFAFALAGCNGNAIDPGQAEDPGNTNEPAVTDEPADAGAETITIVDHTGSEVTIPAEINRVVIDQVPLYAAYVMYMGGGADKLVGIAASNKATLANSVIMSIAPEIADVSTKHNEDGELSVEELLNLKPDVVLYNAGNTEHKQLFDQAGIPSVGFSTSGDPTTLYADWLRLLEDVFQEPGKMDDVITYGDGLISEIKTRTAAVPESERPDMLILFSWKDGAPSVAGAEKHFGHFWLQAANVQNAAAEVTSIASVNLEQIYTWDPDIIIMPGPGQCPITPQEVLDNSVEGADFSPLTAVANKQVYSCNLGMWSWYTPNSDAPLVLQWIAKIAYPDLFEDVDMAQITKTYYHNFYHYDLSDAELNQVLNR